MGNKLAGCKWNLNENETRLLKAIKAIANSVDRKIDANLTSFVGILSVPDVFLPLRDFKIKFTSLEEICLAEGKVFLPKVKYY